MRSLSADVRALRTPFSLLGAALLGAAALLQIFFYLGLTNRSSWFSAATPEQLRRVPEPNFRLGTVEWPVAEYATSPQLEPFRAAFRGHCGGRSGVSAAQCVSDALARQFRHGVPPAEFVDRDFDPIAHLRRHEGGAPGHCMNRSAIVASQLLAVGIPARVAQLAPTDGNGHTVVEVWDDQYGWAVVDPTFGAVAGDGLQPRSALALVTAPKAARWFELGLAPAPSSLIEQGRKSGPEPRLYKGGLVYPEPWLYLRIGEKQAPWPFRGTFVYLQGGHLQFGTRHEFLRLGIAICGLGSVVLLLVHGRNASGVGHRHP